MENTTHTPGSFCTAVLRTRDMERAAAFYGALIGWTRQTVSVTPGHQLLQFNGKTVASLQQIDEASDIWVPHVSVEDIERTVTEALTLGATLVDRVDLRGVARLASLRDTEGALFGLWQPSPHQGAQLTEVAGSLLWIEVLSGDAAKASTFYERLFGWTATNTSFEPFDSYTVFKRGDVQEGGLLPIGKDWEVSPRWNSIFAVTDCDAVMAHAETLGGCA